MQDEPRLNNHVTDSRYATKNIVHHVWDSNIAMAV